jgi:Flp pilus assembly pilin Flp
LRHLFAYTSARKTEFKVAGLSKFVLRPIKTARSKFRSQLGQERRLFGTLEVGTMTFFVRRFWKDAQGQESAEYALAAGRVALAAVAVMPQLSGTINNVFKDRLTHQLRGHIDVFGNLCC